MSERAFIKMHGLGNDFVVIDARQSAFPLDEAAARAIADRRRGVGCDQLIVIEPPASGAADVFMRIRNADGGEVEACGNATRCVAALVMAERGSERCTVETRAGLLEARPAGPDRIAVDMGEARLGWRDIPLARAMNTLHLELSEDGLSDPVAVNIGNPHAVFFVDDAEAVDLAGLGPRLEHDSLFPERANIGVAQLSGADRLRLRVWERGVGLTRACGTGACAAAVAAHRRGLAGRRVEVVLDGGPLLLEWREDGHVVMTGPVATSFRGVLNGSHTNDLWYQLP
jgi:diaminopimelate epimerase